MSGLMKSKLATLTSAIAENLMTYRELLSKLSTLTDKELDCTVIVNTEYGEIEPDSLISHSGSDWYDAPYLS